MLRSFHLTPASMASVRLQAGYKQLADAAVGRLPSLEPQQVTDLVVGFHK
jgi:hypothetical protein